MNVLDALPGALLIFCLRILDVSLGTIRTLHLVRGDRLKVVPLAFLESGIWVFAISRIMGQLNNHVNMVAYAAGFATGTWVGMTIEGWIASGWVMVRVISGADRASLVEPLRAHGFGVTVVPGEGRQGDQLVIFVVTHRRRGPELVQLVRRLDEDAFVTIDRVHRAIGGYFSPARAAAELKK